MDEREKPQEQEAHKKVALPRLPKKLIFPFGYSVRFKYLKAVDMPASAKSDWEEETGIVRVNKERTHQQKMEDVVHEIGHAYIDWMRHVEKLLGRD